MFKILAYENQFLEKPSCACRLKRGKGVRSLPPPSHPLSPLTYTPSPYFSYRPYYLSYCYDIFAGLTFVVGLSENFNAIEVITTFNQHHLLNFVTKTPTITVENNGENVRSSSSFGGS